MKRTGIRVRSLCGSFRRDRLYVLGIAVLLLAFFAGNGTVTFATDTYALSSSGFENYSYVFRRENGRVVADVIYRLWAKTGLSLVTFFRVSFVSGLLLLGASLLLTAKKLEGLRLPRFFALAGAVLLLVNPLVLEFFMFIETGIMLLGVAAAVLAFHLYDRVLRTGKLRWLPAVLVCLLISVFSYQASTAVFVLLAMVFLYFRAERPRSYFLAVLGIVLLFSAAMLANMVYLRYAGIGERDGLVDFRGFLKNWEMLMKTAGEAFRNCFGILPPHVYSGLTLALLAGLLMLLLFGKALPQVRQKLCLLGHVLLTVLAVFFSATAPVLFTDSAGVNPRVIYALGGLHGILLVYLVWLMRASDTAQGRRISAVLRPAAAVLLCLFLTVQVFSFQRVITDKHSNTELDKYRCLMIGERIGAYEAESGVEVKSIAVVRHGSPQYDLFSSGSMVVSAFKHSWSAVAAINYFCNTDFTRVTCPARIIEYFSKLDWDTYSDSQLLFEGDTLYLCVY